MEYEVDIDLYRDWISHLREVLTQTGYTPAADREDVSIQYFNLQRRLVPAEPRNIHVAKEFQCPSQLQTGLNLVKEKIKQGMDLRPHLSRKIADLDYDDDLLNDWGIHHIHLGTALDSDGFVKRTGPVLFVRFEKKDAYLISVMKHGSWTNQDMIRIIHRNWPETIQRFRVDGYTRLNKPVTDKDVKAYRAARVFSLIEPEEGVIYLPPGMGLSTAGTGLEVVNASDHYAWLMKTYETIIKENMSEIIQSIKAEGIELDKKFSFSLKIDKKSVYVYDENYNFTVYLGELP